MDGGEYSSIMTYGGETYGGELDCTMRNVVITVIILFLLYVYVYIPSQTNYNDGSSYYASNDSYKNGETWQPM